MIRKILSLFLLFLLSCGVKQPMQSISEQQSGNIVVTSQPDGAVIFLDGENTGKLTPDTLSNVALGAHVVRVSKQGYKVTPDSLQLDVLEAETAVATFSLQVIQQQFTIFVESFPQAAAIYVDDQPTGQMTPDSIIVSAGSHLIQVQKNGYRSHEWSVDPTVETVSRLSHELEILNRQLLEVFGNVSCAPCVLAAENLHTFENEISHDEFAILEYFASWPSPNDPFYKAAPQDVMQRVMYYNITALPAMMINGIISADSRFYDEIVTKYTAAQELSTPAVGISVQKKMNSNMLVADVELYFPNGIENVADYRLYVAVTEDSIAFDSPPGTNGLTDFNFVFRGFASDRKGDALELNGSKAIFHYEQDMENGNGEALNVIAFLQNETTKQIIQTGRTGD